MGFWAIAGPAIASAAAGIIGGKISNRDARKQVAQQEAIQREFAQYGIRWKVADAKAAGLHPLYATGAAGASYTPSYYSDAVGPAIARAGGQLASSLSQNTTYKHQKQQQAAERLLRWDQLETQTLATRSQAQLNDAMAQYYLSEAARNAQDQGPGVGRMAQSVVSNPQISKLEGSGMADLQPSALIPSDPVQRHRTPTKNPFWEYSKGWDTPIGNITIVHPRADNPGEALEGLGGFAATLVGTTAHYLGKGIGWTYRNWRTIQREYPKVVKQIGSLLASERAGYIRRGEKIPHWLQNDNYRGGFQGTGEF
jgi:hypothetical protein